MKHIGRNSKEKNEICKCGIRRITIEYCIFRNRWEYDLLKASMKVGLSHLNYLTKTKIMMVIRVYWETIEVTVYRIWITKSR